MLFFTTFIIEIISLFFLSKKLINSLARIIFKITKSNSVVINILAIIFLPGTIFHELSHLLTAGVLLVPVGELKALPEIEGERVKLGSVEIGKVDPFRLTLVGVAPVVWGMLSIFGIIYFAQTAKNLIWWQALLGLYLIFQIGNTMFSSKKDVMGTLGFVIAMLIIFLAGFSALYFLRPLLIQNIWISLNQRDLSSVTNFFKLGSLYFLIPLSLDFIVILLTKIQRQH